VGLREEAIEAVRHRKDVGGLEPDERDIVLFVRQLLRTNRVEQSLFEELQKRKGTRWVVELTATIGQYQYIAAINGVFKSSLPRTPINFPCEDNQNARSLL